MIKFSEHTSFTAFEEAVDALPYWGGGTRINKALDVAHNEMFQESNGMHSDAHKILVLITDGQQHGVDYAAYATLFQNSSIRVIVIGVGNVNAAELLDLVAVDSDFHLAENFDVLLSESFIESITLCNGMLLYIS